MANDDGPRFRPVDPKVRFPELEERILAFWDEADVFRRSLAQREGAPEWVFYDGPPTANAKPHIGHALTRTFKDVYPRYRTMTGHLVHRKAGWDCHGLPVEIEVEREIGSKSKRDIEAFGIAEFVERCRQSVRRYVRDWEELTRRIGFWIDMDDAYWTMDPSYVESVWWSLKRLHERGLLVEADKVTAYCPRCGTALSDAEVALGYETAEDPSIHVLFPITESADEALVGASLLVWTTTPWTLPSNAGAAVDPDATYVIAERDGERVVLAEARVADALGEDWTTQRRLPGHDLLDARYEPPYPNIEDAHRVVAGAFVALDEGTGIVHMAPAFGPEDLEVGLAQGWAVFKPVGDDGRFTDLAPEFVRGAFVKDADPAIEEDLRVRGLLFRSGRIEHTYPFCWRCGTPLLYYARTSWYVRTTAVKERLLEVNEDVKWYPDHIKRGRYGNWLENNVDWALSRERYWGTPLPIWRCDEGHATAVGSLRELGELAGRDLVDLDPHRPVIDDVVFDCPQCGQNQARRVPEVIDTWYDSGAMPFAQWGYHPELGRGQEIFERRFPADFVSEAIDQTRGWFYTLMAEGVLHFDSTAYRHVVCFEFIVDEAGRKMSKSVGNVVDPMPTMERFGADALRWVLLTSGSPWSSRRLGDTVLEDAVRRFLLTLWHVYSFFVLYANADGVDPDARERSSPSTRPVLDRWVLSQLAGCVREVRDAMDAYDVTGAGRRIQAFVDDLSNWYVRRSRRRFWDPGGAGGDGTATAFETLHECLVTTATLLAPFTPFVAEEVWSNIAAGRAGRPDSVHLADYPAVHESLIDPGLDEAMALARRVVELGRRIRTETRMRTRQPLARAVIHLPAGTRDFEQLLDVVADELNVKSVELAGSAEAFGRWRAKPDFTVLGPRLGSAVQTVAAALAADDGALADRLADGEPIELDAGGRTVSVGAGDVQLTRDAPPGLGVATEGGVTVALDLDVTPALRREGVARELVRLVQDARKDAGLEVSDRIVLGIETSGEPADALAVHGGEIAEETLASDLGTASIDGFRQEAELDRVEIVISLRRAT